MSGSARVSIPQNVRKTIQDIKEIAKNHSDEEVYAMLRECSMDPNETVQKLLLQDPFHEVRRKRDKKKEISITRESADSRRRPGTQGRGGRVGRGNYSPRYSSHDAGGVRNVSIGKESGVNQRSETGVVALSAPHETENKGMLSSSSSITGTANGPTNVGIPTQRRAYSPGKPAVVGVNKLENALPSPIPSSVEAKSSPSSTVNITHAKHPNFDSLASPVSVLGVYPSASDPVLVPSLGSRHPAAGTIKREVGSQRTTGDSNSIPAERKSAATQDITKRHYTNKSRNAGNSELSSSMDEKATPEIGHSFIHGGTSTSRPSSNYGSRSQQLIGSQKAIGPSKEWKPKPINQNSAPASVVDVTSDAGPVPVEAGSCLLPKSSVSVSEEAESKLQHKLEQLQLSDTQHVIIPNHLQVPESERTGLSFGSFDASFGLNGRYVNGPETEKSSTPLSESSQGVEEAAEELYSSIQNASPNAQEGEYHDHTQSPSNVPEDLSPAEVDVSNAVLEIEQSKSEAAPPVGGSLYPAVVPTTPNYSFGLIAPPILGTQFAPFDTSEPQARDASRIPSIVVQQPFDPSPSHYTQILRPNAEGDGRFSPFFASGAAAKYNGNVTALSPQSGQPPQESGNSLVLSTAAPTSLVTQAPGVMQSSLAVPQQPLPFIRQASGVHLPHYPPNYIPYGQFYPFYVPTPIHHYVSNAAFPQQPPTGNMYPPSAAAATPGVKYSLPQYKPGTNTGNPTHVGTPTGYTPYNSTPAGYNPNPVVTAGNSTGNEDLSASQFKENNYIPGQQSEGSVWIPAPGREVSGYQANSFYSLSPQGQPIAFSANQAAHGTFPGMYHPTQTVAAPPVHPLLQQSQTMGGVAEMSGPPAGLYQQPQRNMNWSNSY